MIKGPNTIAYEFLKTLNRIDIYKTPHFPGVRMFVDDNGELSTTPPTKPGSVVMALDPFEMFYGVI